MKKAVLKHIIIIGAICMVLVMVIFYTKSNIVTEIYGRSQSRYINDSYDSPSVVLDNKTTVVEDFTHEGDIYALSFRFHNNGTLPEGTVRVEVIDKSSDQLVLSGEQNVQLLASDAYSNIIFETPHHSNESTEYELHLSANFVNENHYVQLWENSESGDIALGVSYDMISDDIYKFIDIIIVLSCLIVIIIYCVIFIFNFSKETNFLVCIILVSLIYTLVLPPYSSPDEEAHINSAYKLQNQLSGYSDEELANNTIYKRSDDFNETLEDHYTTVFSYEYVYNNLVSLDESDSKIAQRDSWLVSDFPAVYAAGSLGLAVGEVFNLGYLTTLYLGRLFNLILFSILAYFSVKITPVGKEIFVVLSFLPITLHLINSFSRDTFVIGMAFVFTAYVLRLIHERDKISIKELLVLLIMLILLTPSKTIYAPMILLAVPLIGKFNLKIFIKNKRKIIYTLTGILAGIFLLISLNRTFFNVVLSVFKTPHSLEYLLVNSPESTFNIGLLISNPVIAVNLVLNTIAENLSYYIKSSLGGVLSYNSVIIDDFFIFVFLVLVFISTMKMPNEKINFSLQQKIIFFITFLIIFATVVYVGISWTPVVDKVIYGIQGKYLLPIIPAALMLLKNNVFKVEKDIFKPILFFSSVCSVGVAFNAFIVILAR